MTRVFRDILDSHYKGLVWGVQRIDFFIFLGLREYDRNMDKVAAFRLAVAISLVLFFALLYGVQLIWGGQPPGMLGELRGTSSLTSADSEEQAIESTLRQAQLINGAAGSILALLFANILFGSKLPKRNSAQFFGVSAAVLSLGTLIFGYLVINEIKWILMFEVGVHAWQFTRLTSFQMAQILSIFLTIMAFSWYAYQIMMEKLNHEL